MQRIENMARRLPQLYRDGELLRGGRSTGGVLEVPAVQIEVVDEIAREIQRTHWFDATYELEHAAKLAALLDFTPQSWQQLDIFRPWVHALRDAMLLDGGVTIAAIERFVSHYAKAFQPVEEIAALTQVDTWNDAESAAGASPNSAPALIENPKARQFARFPATGVLEPLAQFGVTSHALKEVPLSLLMTGTPRGREAAPLIANLTTGAALVFMDEVPEGKRLWIRGRAGKVTVQLENEDVTSKLRSIAALTPGTPFTASQLVTPPQPLMLKRGENKLWFFPMALFDVLGLDRFLFSMPDLAEAEGRYDATQFDHALFFQEPVMALHAAWTEETPASLDVRLPAAALLSTRSAQEALPRRALLESSVAEGIGLLRAAGVTADLTMERLYATQPQLDRLALIEPLRLSDRGPMGADRITESAGMFEVTQFDDSTFR